MAARGPHSCNESHVEAFVCEVHARLESLQRQSTGAHDEVLSVSFPASFSSGQRKYVHQTAQKMGLHSQSCGEGEARCITVYSAPLDDLPATRAVRRGFGDGPEASWQERLSRTLSSLLRHRAEEEGLQVGSDGFAELRKVLALSSLQRLGTTQDQVQRLIADFDPKHRFVLRKREDGVLLIRATQGHTMKKVKDEELLRRVENPEEFPICVHGTCLLNWHLIKESGGLSRTSRNHIHFAPRPPGHGEVISGMREDCDVAVYVNLASAHAAGIAFFVSDNGVILSPGDGTGIIPLQHIQRVENICDGKCLWPAARCSPLEESSDDEEVVMLSRPLLC